MTWLMYALKADDNTVKEQICFGPFLSTYEPRREKHSLWDFRTGPTQNCTDIEEG